MPRTRNTDANEAMMKRIYAWADVLFYSRKAEQAKGALREFYLTLAAEAKVKFEALS